MVSIMAVAHPSAGSVRDRDRDRDRDRLGWGLVGCGWVASDYVAPAIVGSANGRLVGVFDPDPAAMHRLVSASAPGGLAPPDRHGSLDDLLADPRIAAVYVATPNHLHKPIVVACARAGKAVLCEKPMATHLADAEAMVVASEAAGTLYATAFDQRFHPAHRLLRSWVADGSLGVITQARIHYACWLPGNWAGDNWRVDPARAGGGAMIDLAPHGVDLLEVILGDEWVDLFALRQRKIHDYAVDDGAVLAGRFARGALATLHVAYNCPEHFPRRTLELIGTEAMVIATDTMGQTPGGRLVRIDAATGARTEQVLPDDPRRSPFVAQVEAFAAALRGGPAFPFPARRDLRTFALLEAACR